MHETSDSSIYGTNIDTADNEGNTALHFASAYNQEEFVAFLCTHGANVDAENNIGWTPLMQAARHGNYKILNDLIKRGADLHKKTKIGATSLMLACASGCLNSVRILIDNGCIYDPTFNEEDSYFSPIMVASFEGAESVVSHLLHKGIGVNKSMPSTGLTALMFATCEGHECIIQSLIQWGAKVDISNVANFTAGDMAPSCNNKNVRNGFGNQIESFNSIKKDSQLSDVMESVKNGNCQSLQDILKKDAEKAKFVSSDGATPLMIGAMMGHLTVVQLLLSYGADINACDYINGWTALMQAVYHSQSRMSLFLIENGADIYISSSKGYTVFDLANEVLDVEVLKVLSKKQISAFAFTPSGSNDNRDENLTNPSFTMVKTLCNKLSHKFSAVNAEPKCQVSHNKTESKVSIGSSITDIEFKPLIPDLNLTNYSSDDMFDRIRRMEVDTMNDLLTPPPLKLCIENIAQMPRGSKLQLKKTNSDALPFYIEKWKKMLHASEEYHAAKQKREESRKNSPNPQINTRERRTFLKESFSSISIPSEFEFVTSRNSTKEFSFGSNKYLSRSSNCLASNFSDECNSNFLTPQRDVRSGHRVSYDNSQFNNENCSNSYDNRRFSYDNDNSNVSHMDNFNYDIGRYSFSNAETVSIDKSSGGFDPRNRDRFDESIVSDLTVSIGSGKLSSILEKISMGDLAELFEQEEVDFEAFLLLKPGDLQDLGVNSHSINRIMNAVKSLKEKYFSK